MSETAADMFLALAARFGETVDVPADLAGAGTLAGIAAHRTHREFADRAVPAELMRLIYACALCAPSKSDLQQCDIVEVVDPALRGEIAELLPSMPWVREAPVFAVICGNGRRLRQISTLHGETFGNDHLDAFFNATLDAGIVLGHLLVAAEAAGLVTCPISVIRNHAARVSELLGLPDHVFPASGICIGWPAASRPISSRLSLGSTLHRDRYDDRDWEPLVTGYDERRGRAEGWDPGGPDFKGWSQRKAAMYAEPQRTDFGAFIRAKGFNLE